MQFGRCYEEFEVGALYKHWPGRTITEYDDTLFCMLTMNHNPLHIDANYTENTRYKQRLVAGPLIFSIALGMSVAYVSGNAVANLEFEYVKHLAPTFHGDTIYAETKVLDKRLTSSKPDIGIVTVETIAYNQRGETVLSFKRRVMIPTKAHYAEQQRAWEEKIESPATMLDYLQYLSVADGEKAKRELGFSPAYTTREALLDFASAQHLRDVRLLSEAA